MLFRKTLEPLLKIVGHRTRRTFTGDGRAHIELRRVRSKDLAPLAALVETELQAVPGIAWAEVNPYTRRVVVAYDDRQVDLPELVAAVERAEIAADAGERPFGDERPEHPADVEPLARTLVEMGTDVVGLLLASGLRLARVKPLPLQADAATILSLIDSMPPLRKRFDDRLGPLTTELVLNVASSVVQGLNQDMTSLGVDLLYRSTLVREIQARRRAWERREPELCRHPAGFTESFSLGATRPVPLPKGPVEKYGERAWYASLGAFAVGAATTRSFGRATAPMIGCMPKPARLGREAFAAQIGRALASRGIVIMDSRVLRHLDRVDTVVVQGDLVARASFIVGEVVPGRTIDAGLARRRSRALFDPDRPIELRRSRGWELGPLRLLPPSGEGPLAERGRELSRRGALVLGLARKGELVALVEVQVAPQTDVEALIGAARKAEMRVVVASDAPGEVERLGADEIVPGGRRLESAVQRLQQSGAVVCVVGTGRAALLGADVGIGLVRDGEAPPWGAHLLCPADLGHVRFVLEACVAARSASKQSVNIALASASAGAFISAGGLLPHTGRRVMGVVNAATVAAMANGIRIATQLEWRPEPEPRDPTPWHALEVESVLQRLETRPDGLTRREVGKRRRITQAKLPAVLELGRAVGEELLNPLAPLLAAGAGLSAVVGSFTDAAMVAGVVGVNAVLGGVQRFGTERAIDALGRTELRTARVKRGGQDWIVPAEDLVAGDVVVLQAGEEVPADCRIVRAYAVEVDESSLTGESLPVPKSVEPSFAEAVADRTSMLFDGTSVVAGQALAVVTATGDATEARRGVAAAKGAPPKSGVEARLEQLMEMTAPVVALGGLAVAGAGLLRGRPLGQIIDAAVSLAVAAVPEGLPLLATAAQLAAARRLSKRGALVRNPRAIEALGRIDVLCLDKTGTVTEGRVDLRLVTDGVDEVRRADLGELGRSIVAAALRASPQDAPGVVLPHAADQALASLARDEGIARELDAAGWLREAELPFEAERGYHAVLGQTSDKRLLCVKGAPEVVLPRCRRWDHSGKHRQLGVRARQDLAAQAGRLAKGGLRLLAVAERPVRDDGPLTDAVVQDLVFRGFIAFADPVRPSAAAAIRSIRRAGVDVVMCTGDHPSTAEAIAAELDLLGGREVVTGAQLDAWGDDELDRRIGRVAVFARVTPSQKVRIVKAFQRAKRAVAMTGDGANDAPAIRLADVGIAVGRRSTPAARSAADVVVTDDRIETLVDAIVEGRAMWASVRDAVSILVGGNLGEIGFTVAGTLLSGRSPLNARQLLLVNLLTDVAPAMAIALRPPDADAMEALLAEGPERSLGERLDRDIALRAATTGAGAGIAWAIARVLGSHEKASTVALAALVGTQLAQTLLAGGKSREVVAAAVGSAVVLAALIQIGPISRALGCTPLGPIAWTTAIGASAAATLGSVHLPGLVQKLAERLRDAGTAEEATRAVATTFKELAAPSPERARRPATV